jgi:hypothetical protein
LSTANANNQRAPSVFHRLAILSLHIYLTDPIWTYVQVSGIIWAFAQIGWFVANKNLPFVVTFPIINVLPVSAYCQAAQIAQSTSGRHVAIDLTVTLQVRHTAYALQAIVANTWGFFVFSEVRPLVLFPVPCYSYS